MKPILPIRSGRLRPLTDNDTSDLLDLLRLPEIRRYLCDDRIVQRSEVEHLIEESIQHDIDGLGLWVIETDAQSFAGIVGMMPVSSAIAKMPGMKGGIEPFVALAPRVQRQGLAREAMAAILEHTVSMQETAHVVAAVDAPNMRSHRLMRATGFGPFAMEKGPAHDLVLYKLCLSKHRLRGDVGH